jgi:exopolyphosphatase
MTGLLPFLKQARQQLLALPAPRASTAAAASSLSPTTKGPVFVLGNQSADLDSIISAILYSYFFSRADKKAHAPVVNLPDVPSGTELRRLRPEFACAFELSTSSRAEQAHPPGEGYDGNGAARLLKEHIVTVADLREQLLSRRQDNTKLDLEAVLVDWNKPPHQEETEAASGKDGRGSVDGLSDLATFSITGCIDHHADEGFVPAAEALSDDNPRIIELGPGSCTSLIIREVRHRGLWPSQKESSSSAEERNTNSHDVEVEVAKLALAAILIDTGNLTAEGKVTDIDRDAVSFLTQKISEARSSGSSAASTWNQKAFFDEIQHAKAHSLDWLTVDETLGRDYKDWTESTASGEKVTIGIASVVRPLSWVVSKANEEEEGSNARGEEDLKPMIDKLKQFAQQKGLDVVSAMTAFTSDEGRFERELLVWALHDGCTKQLENFAETAKEELQLEQWDQFPVEGHRENGHLYIWRQRNVRNSRKQVAPLLRKVYTGSRSTHI